MPSTPPSDNHHSTLLPAVLTWVQSLLIAAVLVLAVLATSGQVDRIAISSGFAFSGLIAALYGALRIPLPAGRSWPRQAWVELLGTLSYLILLPALLGGLIAACGAYPLLEANATGVNGWTLLMILGLTAPVYLLARGLRRLWNRWADARQRRLAFAVIQAILGVTFSVALLVLLGFALQAASQSIVPIAEAPDAGLFARLANRLVTILLPALATFAAWSLAALLVLAPVSGYVAYRLARRTTRRLEDLAVAAEALAAGDTGARVAVSGRDEVAQLQATFNQMAGRLEQTQAELQRERDTVAGLLESRRKLFADVSHELRTPVATIDAYLDSLLRDPAAPPPATWAQDLQTMQVESGKLRRQLDDLFVLARADMDRLELSCAPVALDQVAQQAVAAFTPFAWQSGGIELVQDIPAGIPLISGDALRLSQVIGNLLRNAIRHTRPGGMVGVFVSAAGASVQLEVRDTGEGMSEEELARIWEPFYQGDAHRAADSAGLGLPLVKTLTERMGGTVCASSQPGEGSCFTLRFPAI